MWANNGDMTMNTSMNQTSSDSPARNNKGARRHQNVVPLRIKQIKEAGRDDFSLFNIPVQLVHLVGVISEINQESTHIVYTLIDFSGEIKVIFWMENTDDNETLIPAVKVDDRVQVFGKVRERDGELTVMLLRMFPVLDANIVTTHGLECYYASLQAEEDARKESVIKRDNPGRSLATTMFAMETEDPEKDLGLSKFQTRIYNIVNQFTGQPGCSLNTVLGHFNEQEHDKVKSAIKFLLDEGHMYTTHDENHFLATTNN